MITEINEIYITGKFPFLVLLEDTINVKGNPIIGEGIEIVVDENTPTAFLYLKRRIREDAIFPTEDLYGEITYSDFLLIFNSKLAGSKELQNRLFELKNFKFDDLTSISTKLLNKFIELYKSVTMNEKDWVPFVTVSRLAPWRVHLFDNNGKYIEDSKFKDYRGTGKMINSLIDWSKVAQLKKHSAQSRITLDPAEKFLMESNRYLMTGDFVSAILFMNFYFEKWIFREVKNQLIKMGDKEKDVDLKLKPKGKQFIKWYNAIKLVTKNTNFKGEERYRKYNTNVIEIRDEIVHRDRANVTADIANEAAKTLLDFRSYITELLKS